MNTNTPAPHNRGDSTFASKSIPPMHLSQTFQITAAEPKLGDKLERLLEVNLRKFTDAINVMIEQRSIEISNSHIAIQFYVWVSESSGIKWASFDTCFNSVNANGTEL